ncbi:hypothetical protein SAMN05216533_2098 [Streptomyces sp. Ag109_O5-10]|nr:hypothetical protein SAMN05216533_2098 [Streptomyces sp. Ag109_O5-10]
MLTSPAHRSRPARTRRLLTGNARIFELGTPPTADPVSPHGVSVTVGTGPRVVGVAHAVPRAPEEAPEDEAHFHHPRRTSV